MSKSANFWLDIDGGAVVLREMCAPMCEKSAQAITQRANAFLSAMTSGAPTIRTESGIGEPNKYGGKRAYTKVRTPDMRRYKGKSHLVNQAIHMAMDAGKV